MLEELRIEGGWPDVIAAIDAGELESALELLLERLSGADENERERIRKLAVASSPTSGPNSRSPSLPAPTGDRPLLTAVASTGSGVGR